MIGWIGVATCYAVDEKRWGLYHVESQGDWQYRTEVSRDELKASPRWVSETEPIRISPMQAIEKAEEEGAKILEDWSNWTLHTVRLNYDQLSDRWFYDVQYAIYGYDGRLKVVAVAFYVLLDGRVISPKRTPRG